MKKRILLFMLLSTFICLLTGCDVKTEQVTKELAFGKTYMPGDLIKTSKKNVRFTMDTENSKEFKTITPKELGEIDVVFNVIKNEKKTDQKITYTFNVVDKTGPTVFSKKSKAYEGKKIKESDLYGVKDDCSEEKDIKVKADLSEINMEKPGYYDYTVTATDKVGNETVKKLHLVVEEDPFGEPDAATKKKVQKAFDQYTFNVPVGPGITNTYEFTNGRAYVRSYLDGAHISNQGTYSIRKKGVRIKFDNGKTTELYYDFNDQGTLFLDTDPK